MIMTGRNGEKLEALKNELLKEGGRVLTLQFDVRDAEAARQAVESIPEEWRPIDVLINNAGLAIGMDKEQEGNIDEWAVMIDTNIKGLLTMTRLIVPDMVARNDGHVINIGSIAGDAAYAGGNVYCATKAAVKALSEQAVYVPINQSRHRWFPAGKREKCLSTDWLTDLDCIYTIRKHR